MATEIMVTTRKMILATASFLFCQKTKENVQVYRLHICFPFLIVRNIKDEENSRKRTNEMTARIKSIIRMESTTKIIITTSLMFV